MLLQTKRHVGRKVIGAMSSVRRMRDKLMKHCGVESRWSNNLPEEILHLVLQRLCIQNYVRCRSVCVSWRGIIDMAIASKCIRPAPQLPWLVLHVHRFSLKDTCFLSLSDQKTYKPNPTHMNRLNCVGSIEGWLVMVDNAGWHPEAFMNLWSFFIHRRYSAYTTVNYFFNPVSGVKLPSQSAIPWISGRNHRPTFFYQVVASSVPTSPHCLVAGLCSNGQGPTDKSWTPITGEEVRGLYFEAIEIIDRKIYAVTERSSMFIMVFDIQDAHGSYPSYNTERLVILHPRPHSYRSFNLLADGVRHVTDIESNHLVKDSVSKVLFLILCCVRFACEVDPIVPWHEIIDDNNTIPLKSDGFRVFKLEFNKGARWVQVDDFGDRILFMDRAGCKFIPASFNNKAVLTRNCICFAFDSPCCFATVSSSRRDFGVFSLTNKTIDQYAFPEDHSCTRLNAQPVWFTPDFC
ncbi:PREDICTED: uncharacterized protein LOC101309469 [Fragaria vesca subsp. vesca]|uniref:uncharacterized protein LOC101309469 n=1 Tax=Fragaria vesca subsp. vesca TaxID=101020 RepID=UPI0002C31D89|nr:PREDICTED: uncharacterized protein LOC101309469 [Fragaria vesca subsp. vesca]